MLAWFEWAWTGLAATSLIVLATLFWLSLVSALPFNTLKPINERKVEPLSVLPQGWSFFTKDPQSNSVFPYVRDGTRWRYAGLGPGFQLRNAFGLNRAYRAQGPEVAGLTALLGEEGWSDCEVESLQCLDHATVIEVTNPVPAPSLCGSVGLVARKPVPWSWARRDFDVEMPSQVTLMEVTCAK